MAIDAVVYAPGGDSSLVDEPLLHQMRVPVSVAHGLGNLVIVAPRSASAGDHAEPSAMTCWLIPDAALEACSATETAAPAFAAEATLEALRSSAFRSHLHTARGGGGGGGGGLFVTLRPVPADAPPAVAVRISQLSGGTTCLPREHEPAAVGRRCRGLALAVGSVLCSHEATWRVEAVEAIAPGGTGWAVVMAETAWAVTSELAARRGRRSGTTTDRSGQRHVALPPLEPCLREIELLLTNAYCPSGILLHGPPGVGKSTAVRLLCERLAVLAGFATEVAMLYGNDLVLDPDPKAVLDRIAVRASVAMGACTGTGDVGGGRASVVGQMSATPEKGPVDTRRLILVVVEDFDALLPGVDNGDSPVASSGGDGGVVAGLFKAFMDDLDHRMRAFSGGSSHGPAGPCGRVCVLAVSRASPQGVGSGGGGGGGGGGALASMVRAGRLEKCYGLTAPTTKERTAILIALLTHFELNSAAANQGMYNDAFASTAIDTDRLASLTPGFVAADLVRLCDTAGLNMIARRSNGGGGGKGFGGLAWEDATLALNTVAPSELRELDVKSAPSSSPSSASAMSWNSIGGYEATKDRLVKVVQWPWQNPQAFTSLGITGVSGVLLYGPSGCGKSLFAQVLAAETRANFVWVHSSELLSMWLGESERMLRELFARARAAAPCILFFDELDALVSKRNLEGGGGDGSGGGSSVDMRILTTLLSEMDGIAGSAGAHHGVLVLAATNRHDTLDAALLRPGRLHECVEISMPTEADRAAVLALCCGKLALAPDVTGSRLCADRPSGDEATDLPMDGSTDDRFGILDELAKDAYTAGWTPADLAALCRDAGLQALRRSIAATAPGSKTDFDSSKEGVPRVAAADFVHSWKRVWEMKAPLQSAKAAAAAAAFSKEFSFSLPHSRTQQPAPNTSLAPFKFEGSFNFV